MWHNKRTSNVQITKKNDNKLNWHKWIAWLYLRKNERNKTHFGDYFH